MNLVMRLSGYSPGSAGIGNVLKVSMPRFCGLLLLAPLLATGAVAAEPENGAKAQIRVATQAVTPRPLTFPATFDRLAVQSLLTQIDQGRNDQVLWAGYFVFNGSRELPGSEGRELLQTSLAAEKPGTLRWFKLQYLNTYFSARYVSPEAGLAAYEAVFQAAEEVQTQGKPSPRQSQIIARLVDQYVNFLPLPWLAQADNGRLNAALAAAFRCWTRLPLESTPGEGVLSPRMLHVLNWGAAAQAIGGASLKAEVESQLKAQLPGSAGRDVTLLLASADVLRTADPGRAQRLAGEARALLPLEPTGLPSAQPAPGEIMTRNQWSRYRALLVDSLSRQEKWGESAEVQRQAVATSGEGYPKLVQLLFDGGRTGELEAVLKPMETSRVGEGDLLETAALLQEQARGASGPRRQELVQWAQRLYRAELAPGRERTASGELAARTHLARSLWLQARQTISQNPSQNRESQNGEVPKSEVSKLEAEIESVLSPAAARQALADPEASNWAEEFQSVRQQFIAWKTQRQKQLEAPKAQLPVISSAPAVQPASSQPAPVLPASGRPLPPFPDLESKPAPRDAEKPEAPH